MLGRYGRRLAPGTVICEEGAPATEAFLLQQGSVRLLKRVGVSERSLAVLKGGDLFGESALTHGAIYGSTAAALTESVVLVLDRDDVPGPARASTRSSPRMSSSSWSAAWATPKTRWKS